MKTNKSLKTVLALFIMAGLSLSASASSDPTSITVTSAAEKTAASMTINVSSDMDTYVSVLDQEGTMIYSDMVSRDEKPGKMYDFSEVENGVYTFKSVTEHKMVETTFVIEKNELKVLDEKTRYRPVFWIEDDILLISYMNLEQDDIYISVQDELSVADESNLYYEEITESDMSYERIFDIQNLSEGEYTITLKSGENTYKYFFDK